MALQVATVQRPARREVVCGDAFVVRRAASTATVALADGLGHGPKAAEAALVFCEHVRQHETKDLNPLFEGAHRALAPTRGAAAAILRIDEASRRLSFVGVGNIALICEGDSRIKPFSIAGVVGKRVRRVQVFDYDVVDDVLVMMASDGISTRMNLQDYASLEAQQLARAVLDDHGKFHDDATCIVVRWTGTAALPTNTREPSVGAQTLELRNDTDSVWTSRRTARFAEELGFSRQHAWEVGIAVSELVSNAVKHGGGGELTVRAVDEPRRGLEVVVVDRGPGIDDAAAAVEDGYSRGRRLTLDERIVNRDGLGLGLGAVVRLMDDVDLENREHGGLRVVARKWLP